MSELADYDDEPTRRTLAELTPRADDVRDAVARLRYSAHQDRTERRALKRWAMGVIASVIAASLGVAVMLGQYIERVDATTRSLERIEQRLIDGDRR